MKAKKEPGAEAGTSPPGNGKNPNRANESDMPRKDVSKAPRRINAIWLIPRAAVEQRKKDAPGRGTSRKKNDEGKSK